MAADPIIEASSVRKSFGATRALDGLDLTAGRGRVLGLLGPNGAGKTTLVRIFATLLRPDAGRVSIGGADVVGQPVAVRRMIGLAGQHAAVDETLTGRENLQMVGRLYRLTARQASSRAAGVLARLSLGDAADRLVRTYSGGMRRRLDVGATLVGGPRRSPQTSTPSATSSNSAAVIWPAPGFAISQSTIEQTVFPCTNWPRTRKLVTAWPASRAIAR